MHIYFKEDTHQYFNSQDEQYISVSALAHKLEAEKDWDSIKVKYSLKTGLSVEEIEADWERKRQIGVNVGHKFHYIKEQELLNNPKPKHFGIDHKTKSCDFKEGLKYSIPLSNLQDNTVYPELIIHNHDYKVAGQSDKVFVTNNQVWVYDYKTDKSIDFNAFSNFRIKPEMLLDPVSHLENCNGNMYSLKMSTYMHMILEANPNLTYGGIILEHVILERDSNKVPILNSEGNPIVINQVNYPIPFRQKEVINIF